MHATDIRRLYRVVHGEGVFDTLRNQYLNGNKSKRLVPYRLDVLFYVLMVMFAEDRDRLPTDLIHFYLDPTNPKDLPLILEKYVQLKAEKTEKETGEAAFLENIEKMTKANQIFKKKAEKKELRRPHDWMWDFLRRSRQQLN